MDMQIHKKRIYDFRIQHSKFAVCRLHTCEFKKMLLLKNISCG